MIIGKSLKQNIKWQPIAKPRQLLLDLAALSISGNSTSASRQLNMSPPLSKLWAACVVRSFCVFSPFIHFDVFSADAFWLSAVMLCALLLCALGAPVEDAPTDSPAAGDPSGEEEEGPSDLLSTSGVWDLILGATRRHQKEVKSFQEIH